MRRTAGDNFAFVDHHHPVAVPGFLHVMRGYKNGDALAGELFDKSPKMPARNRINAGSGFIQEQ